MKIAKWMPFLPLAVDPYLIFGGTAAMPPGLATIISTLAALGVYEIRRWQTRFYPIAEARGEYTKVGVYRRSWYAWPSDAIHLDGQSRGSSPNDSYNPPHILTVKFIDPNAADADEQMVNAVVKAKSLTKEFLNQGTPAAQLTKQAQGLLKKP